MASLTWNQYFTEMACLIAKKSKDTTQVGCVAVGVDNEVLSTGFNGLPRGVADLEERYQRPAKYLFVTHSEINCVAHAARIGVSLKGARLYVTHPVCCRCAGVLIQAGIREVRMGNGTTSMPKEEFEIAQLMFNEAGVEMYSLMKDVYWCIGK